MSKRYTGMSRNKVKSIYRKVEQNLFHNRMVREGFTVLKQGSGTGRHEHYKKDGKPPIVLNHRASPAMIAGAVAKYLELFEADEHEFLMECSPKQKKDHNRRLKKQRLAQEKAEKEKEIKIAREKRLLKEEEQIRIKEEEQRLKEEALKERQITITKINEKKEIKEMKNNRTFIIKVTRTIEQEVHYEVQADSFAKAYNDAIELAEVNEAPGEEINVVSGSSFNIEVFGCEEVREVA